MDNIKPRMAHDNLSKTARESFAAQNSGLEIDTSSYISVDNIKPGWRTIS